jgi:hypothetical protein
LNSVDQAFSANAGEVWSALDRDEAVGPDLCGPACGPNRPGLCTPGEKNRGQIGRSVA